MGVLVKSGAGAPAGACSQHPNTDCKVGQQGIPEVVCALAKATSPGIQASALCTPWGLSSNDANQLAQKHVEEKTSQFVSQLEKIFDDLKSHQCSSFKAYLICRGLSQFFQKLARLDFPSDVSLSPGFNVAKTMALKVGLDAISNDDCIFHESLHNYANDCFSDGFKDNQLLLLPIKKRKVMCADVSVEQNLFDVQRTEGVLSVLSLLPILVSRLEIFLKNNLTKKVSEHIFEFFHEFMENDFSEVWSLAKIDVASVSYENERKTCAQIRKQTFDELMANDKAFDEDVFCKEMAGPIFYPIFFAAVFGKVLDGNKLSALDEKIMSAVSANIASGPPELWLNAMLDCGLVGLKLDNIKFGSEEESGYSFVFKFCCGVASNLGDIGDFEKHQKAFFGKHEHWRLEVFSGSPCVFDFSNEQFDLMKSNKFELFLVDQNGARKKLPLSAKLVNVIMGVFQSIPGGELLSGSIAFSLGAENIKIKVPDWYTGVVDGFSCIKLSRLEKENESCGIYINIVSGNIKNKGEADGQDAAVDLKFSVRLLLNKIALYSGPRSTEKIPVFLKKNTVSFEIVDQSDPNEPKPYPVNLLDVPSSFFEKLAGPNNRYPFFRKFSSNYNLLKILLRPLVPLGGESEQSSSSNSASINPQPFSAQVDGRTLKKMCGGLSRSKQRLLSKFFTKTE